MTSEAPPIIELNNVFVSHQDTPVLRNINAAFSKNEITTIVGPNGAGKSTLVKLIAGIIKPLSGQVIRQADSKVGYVPQKIHLNANFPIKVSRFLKLAGINNATRESVLSRLNITHLYSAQMATLSGGELQRVLLARAISANPNVLILDEPLQGIDINGQSELYQLIGQLRSELNACVIMVSHDLHLVMGQTDQVLCLNQHVCCHGKPESVSQHPEYIKLFGQHQLKDMAIYTHHHDHHHDLDGKTVDCGDNCQHD